MINTERMDELEKNMPDDFWRKTFDEAAETPPPRVWDSIERRLDESNSSGIIPLWGSGLASSKPLFWATGIAASLALLFVGWWVVHTQSMNRSISRVQLSDQTKSMALNSAQSANSSVTKSTALSPNSIASVDRSASTLPSSAELTDQAHLLSRSSGRLVEKRMAQATLRFNGRATLSSVTTSASQILSITGADAPAPTLNRVMAAFGPRVTGTEPLSSRAEVAVFKELRGRSLRLRSPGPIQRIVWSRPAELSLEPTQIKEKRRSKELWASVSAMPGAFNPLVSLRSTPVQTVANTSAIVIANSSQPSINSRANFSVAYQASAGVQLNERWSVESGIGYLAGHSVVESSAQVMTNSFSQMGNVSRNAGSNAYVDALRNSASDKAASNAPQAANYAGPTYDLVVGNYANQTQQTLANDYQYMQVPVQVGYQLRPRKKVSLAVLGGLLTNIFVRNTVGSDVVVTAKDGVYKPVSLAATMGARFRYRPSGRWSASLAGLYQPALGEATETTSQVQSHPTSTGMSFGLDYHF